MQVGTTAPTNGNDASFAQQATKALGKDDFLKLLITQLQNQDPTNPVNDKEFIAQLAQFSSLEQMSNLTTTMNTMMESQQKLSALGQATTMIGKVVEIVDVEQSETFHGKVTGVQFKNGWPELVVDGKLYDFTQIAAIYGEGVGDE